MTEFQLYDTTLRDGTQREGISLTVADKLLIVRKLDELGIPLIEGGWPGSNPKDAEFFSSARNLKLNRARLVAFGSTRKPYSKAEKDPNLIALINSGTGIAAVVGKSSDLQVSQVLETDLEENLNMIRDSVAFLRNKGMTVLFDAEHFFDGYKHNADYSRRCLAAAAEAGASCLVLCDTNGGTLPEEIAEIVKSARMVSGVPVGIHAHNDAGLAVANSLEAVKAGALQVQGTINGYGERCGNANLCTIIPNLKLKMGINCVTDEELAKLTEVSRYISDVANLPPDPFAPYVGTSAFSHKGGLHAAAINKWEESYQHIDPAQVGNHSRVLISELAGKGNIVYKAREMGIELPPQGEEVKKLLEQVKNLESRGFQYDHAEASFELLLHRAKPSYESPFKLVDFMVIIEKRRRLPSYSSPEDMLSEAMVKVQVGNEIIHTAAEGNGPVNALDAALRKALVQFYPSIAEVKLTDYKVRILEESIGTGSQVRVIIESVDGGQEWRTVGSSTNIIEASWLALADSLEYWLLKQKSLKQ